MFYSRGHGSSMLRLARAAVIVRKLLPLDWNPANYIIMLDQAAQDLVDGFERVLHREERDGEDRGSVVQAPTGVAPTM